MCDHSVYCFDYGSRCDIRVCAVSIMDRGMASGCVLCRLWIEVWHQGVCCVDYGQQCDIRVCAVSIMDSSVTSGCVLFRLWTAM